MSGDVCLRWLAAKPPNLDEARQAVEAIIRDGTRASSVIARIRGLLRRGERLRKHLDITHVVGEVIALLDSEQAIVDALADVITVSNSPFATESIEQFVLVGYKGCENLEF